jgi:GNAT superfamily N-acetyltransferase
MELSFAFAADPDAAELAALHCAAAEDLTRRFGHGFWSASQNEKSVLRDLSRPRFSRVLIARAHGRIAATLRLATKKPWAIDTARFTQAERPLYLTGMATHPDFQRKGVGRLLLEEAEAVARGWPGDAIRLDAFDSQAGAGAFYAKCGMREVAHVVYRNNPLVYFERIIPNAL